MNAKLEPLHGRQIHIRYKAEGFYRVCVPMMCYGPQSLPLEATDDRLDVALYKLASIIAGYPEINPVEAERKKS